jgi:hypothetical protein
MILSLVSFGSDVFLVHFLKRQGLKFLIAGRRLKEFAFRINHFLGRNGFDLKTITLDAVFKLQNGEQREEFPGFQQFGPLVLNQARAETMWRALVPGFKGKQLVRGPDFHGLAGLLEFIAITSVAEQVGFPARSFELGRLQQA